MSAGPTVRVATIGSAAERGSDFRPLKIVLASVGPFVGGAEIAAERLASGLSQAGHAVTVILGHRNAVWDRMQSAGLRCLYAPLPLTDKRHPFRTLASRAWLWALVRREGPNLLHANDLPTHQAVSWVARAAGVPMVCHHRFPFDGKAIDWLNKHEADRHIFISNALMKEMTRESSRLAASPRSVVHDGLPLPPLPSDDDRACLRRKLGLPADKVLVLFAGQVIPIKGVADLVEAWSKLNPVLGARAELLIVGEDMHQHGAYREAMQALASRLECPARFVGFRSDVADWMTAADVVVVPSHVEPLGLVVMEAMAAGRPVVGSEVGGIPEMLRHEETGLLVAPRSPGPLSEALARLIAEPDLRARFGERGRARCEAHFSLDAHVAAVLSEYETVLRARSGIAHESAPR